MYRTCSGLWHFWLCHINPHLLLMCRMSSVCIHSAGSRPGKWQTRGAKPFAVSSTIKTLFLCIGMKWITLQDVYTGCNSYLMDEMVQCGQEAAGGGLRVASSNTSKSKSEVLQVFLLSCARRTTRPWVSPVTFVPSGTWQTCSTQWAPAFFTGHFHFAPFAANLCDLHASLSFFFFCFWLDDWDVFISFCFIVFFFFLEWWETCLRSRTTTACCLYGEISEMKTHWPLLEGRQRRTEGGEQRNHRGPAGPAGWTSPVFEMIWGVLIKIQRSSSLKKIVLD